MAVIANSCESYYGRYQNVTALEEQTIKRISSRIIRFLLFYSLWLFWTEPILVLLRYI